MCKLLASHNTLSYARADGVLSWLLNPFSRCQSLPIDGQWGLGARVFDIRVRMLYEGVPQACHGLCDYDADVDGALRRVRLLSERGGETVYVRVMHENSLRSSSAAMFDRWWRRALREVGGGGVRWRVVPDKCAPGVTAWDEWGDLGRGVECIWYRGRRPWWPKRYAERWRERDMAAFKSSDNGVWWFDFLRPSLERVEIK